MPIRQLSRGEFLARSIFIATFLALPGCGGSGSGDGGKTNSLPSPNTGREYDDWVTDTLSDLGTRITSETAQFVDLNSNSDTNLITNILGWVRVEGQSGIDKIKRWSDTPDEAERLLIDAVNTISVAGTEKTFNNSFSTSVDNSISVSFLKLIIGFLSNNQYNGSVIVKISYTQASVSWLSDIALKKMLKAGGFTQEFNDLIVGGKVKLYRGAIALQNVSIELTTTSSGLNNIIVGQSYKDPDPKINTGITLNVTAKNTSNSTGSIKLNVASDLFIGIAQKTLLPEDIGRAILIQSSEIDGIAVNQVLNYDKESGSGRLVVKNNSSTSLNWSNLVLVITTSDAVGNKLCHYFYYGIDSLRPQDSRPIDFDFSVIKRDENFIKAEIFDVGLFSPTTNTSGAYSGILSGGSSGDPAGLGNVEQYSLYGFISVEGRIHFIEAATNKFMLEGTIDNSLNINISSIFGNFSGLAIHNASGYEGKLIFPFTGTIYTLIISLNTGASSTGGSSL